MQNLFSSYNLDRFEIQNKVQHEFQAIGLEMQEFFPKNEWKTIWTLFYKYPVKDVEKAFHVCKKKNIRAIRYLIGVAKKV